MPPTLLHCFVIYHTYKHILSSLYSRSEVWVFWDDLAVEAHSCVVVCAYPYAINPMELEMWRSNLHFTS